MALFNQKLINKRIGESSSIPEDHLAILAEWAETINSGLIKSQNEVQLHGEFKSRILVGVLGYQAISTTGEWTVAAEQAMGTGSVDLALGRFGEANSEIVAPFELKGANTVDLDAPMPGRNKSPVQQTWEYAIAVPGVKWVIVSNYIEVRLYAFGEGNQAYECFDLRKLSDPGQYARFMLLLSAENLLEGRTLALLEESRLEDKDVTERLYAEYRVLRANLIAAIRETKGNINPLEAIAAGQAILDRILFIAFAEDTGLLPSKILERTYEHSDPYNPKPVWDNFKSLFRAIDAGSEPLKVPRYNGGLFAKDELIDQIDLPDEVCERFRRLAEYDFASEVGVTILGRIFEQSIADIERLQAQARGESLSGEDSGGATGRRKRDGVFYTPEYIARFIVERTIGAHLKEVFSGIVAQNSRKGSDPERYEEINWRNKASELRAWADYQRRLSNLRLVDPACGSGVFLVAAFDFLRAEYERVNLKVAELSGGTPNLFDPDREILSRNLFGVDVNEESIEIAKLSLWLKTARRGKILDSLDGHLKVGDSLIEDSNFAYLEHGFTWADAFPDVFADGGFDIVLGNPPYVRMELIKAIKPYLESRFEVVSDRADLYAYFFERGLKLLREGGRLGFIASSTFFRTASARPLRAYLQREAAIETVVDFGELQVFEGVTTYPAILTMQRRESHEDDELMFWKPESLDIGGFSSSFGVMSQPLPLGSLDEESWTFEATDSRRLRAKLVESRPTLGDVYGAPLRGIVSGLNKAFIIDQQVRDQLVADDPRSAELLEPFQMGLYLDRWIDRSPPLWIIYTPKGLVDIDEYPAVRSYLFQFKDKLEKRATKQEWYELQQAQLAYRDAMRRPKTVYNRFLKDPECVYDLSGKFINDAPYFVPSDSSWLSGYMNSKVAWHFLSAIATPLRGGFVQLHAQYVERLPIPEQDERITQLADQCHLLARQRLALQEAFRRRLPDLAPEGREPKLSKKLHTWWLLADFSALRAEVKRAFKAEINVGERNEWESWFRRDQMEIAKLTHRIKSLEGKIDLVVYELFGLTDSEILLIEAGTHAPD